MLLSVDGREGFDGLERRVESKVAVVAFAIGRVSVQRIMKIADANQLLPPKASGDTSNKHCTDFPSLLFSSLVAG